MTPVKLPYSAGSPTPMTLASSMTLWSEKTQAEPASGSATLTPSMV